MGKFYVSALVLFGFGAFLFNRGYGKHEDWAALLTFLGTVLTLCGAAAFILAFGYHVRLTARRLDAESRGSDSM